MKRLICLLRIKLWNMTKRFVLYWKRNKNLRYSTFIAILLLLISPIIISYINNLLEPNKELEIDINQVSSLDENKNWTGVIIDELFLVYGCKARALFFVNYNSLSNNTNNLRNEEHILTLNTKENTSCMNCTYYFISIYNKGTDIKDLLTLDVDISDKFILDKYDSKLNIIYSNNTPFDKNNLIITIDKGIKGKKSEILSLIGHTKQYSNINFNCYNIFKPKCHFITYNIKYSTNQSFINQFLNDLKIILPLYDDNETKIYKFNFEKKKFEEDLSYNSVYKYDKCMVEQGPAVDPSLIF